MVEKKTTQSKVSGYSTTHAIRKNITYNDLSGTTVIIPTIKRKKEEKLKLKVTRKVPTTKPTTKQVHENKR